jgi:hypothetical protein
MGIITCSLAAASVANTEFGVVAGIVWGWRDRVGGGPCTSPTMCCSVSG